MARRKKRASNPDYISYGRKYAHVAIWEAHHGRPVPPGMIVHHRNEIKTDNRTCGGPVPCMDYGCGNLEVKTRRDHILEHRPGRMSGTYIPNKKPPKDKPTCATCGKAKSKNGTICRDCYTASVASS